MRTLSWRTLGLVLLAVLAVGCSKAPPKEEMPKFEKLNTALLDRKDPNFKAFPDNDPKVREVDGIKILDLPPNSAVLAEKGRAVTEGKQVRVHYTGWTMDGKIFDDSWKTGNPATFTVAKGQLIDGWVTALVGMKEGESRMIWIPANKAYGENGNGEMIPPNSPLQFKIDLAEVMDGGMSGDAVDVDLGR